ncbi:MAG: hypothetical protein NTU86_14030 [Burkholderiales bacterium]|nr:hypothetical protein [Burkholderiales bacterium]
MEVVLLVAFVPILAVLSAVANGWALSVLWGWFIAPTFALPHLSIPLAIGVIMTARLVNQPQYDGEKYKDKPLSEYVGIALGMTIIGPLTSVFLGWLVRQFV